MVSNFFRKLLKISLAENNDDRRLIIVVNAVLIIGGLIYVIFEPGPFSTLRLVIVGITILLFIALLLAIWNYLQPARIIFSVAGFLVVTYLISIGGIHDDAIGGYYLLLILCTLFFGRRGLVILGLLNTTAILVVGWGEVTGLITTTFSPLTDVSTVITSAFFMAISSLILFFFITRLTNMVEIARQKEQSLAETNLELNELRTILEQRVQDRTSDLQTSNKKLKTQLSRIKKLQARLLEEAIRDPLTGLYNRRFMNENLTLEIAKAKRMNFPITIFFIDIDHFKRFNDRYGHQVGDRILIEIGEILQKGLRAGDFACRYGGEEFLVILPDMPKEKSKATAERILLKMKNLSLPNPEDTTKVTVSIGISVYPQDATLMDELIFAADQALYFAKLKGRNRVEIISPPKLASGPKA
jgi:diguanylate cyclase (GGDEF)-like protein